MLAGVLAIASPASAAMYVAPQYQFPTSNINVIDLSDAGTYASMVELAKSDEFPKGKVYRDGSWDPPRALEPLTAYTEFIACDFIGSQVWTVVINPNDVPAPFNFVVDSATGEGSVGTGYASPGWNIIMSFHSPGTYHFTVGWDKQNLTFADDDLVLTCP
jgi:hypothetical protein